MKRWLRNAIWILLLAALAGWLTYKVMENRAKRPFFQALLDGEKPVAGEYLRRYPSLIRARWYVSDGMPSSPPPPISRRLRRAALRLLSRQREPSLAPLHWPAMFGRKEVVELLLAKGAEVNAKDSNGWIPLHYAAMYGHKEIVELLLSKGAEVNANNKSAQTPLHYAAAGGHKESVELLLAKGAEVNARDNVGQTPLRCAAYTGHTDVVEFLKAHGATE